MLVLVLVLVRGGHRRVILARGFSFRSVSTASDPKCCYPWFPVLVT